jgi:hypothetical protein
LDQGKKKWWKVGENFIKMKLQLVIFADYNYNDQVKKYEYGRTCSTYGEKGNIYAIGFWWECQKERDRET